MKKAIISSGWLPETTAWGVLIWNNNINTYTARWIMINSTWDRVEAVTDAAVELLSGKNTLGL